MLSDKGCHAITCLNKAEINSIPDKCSVGELLIHAAADRLLYSSYYALFTPAYMSSSLVKAAPAPVALLR